MAKALKDMEPGERGTTPFKIISGTDIDLFADVARHGQLLFLSDQYAQSLGWKGRITPGCLTFSCSIGLIEESGMLEDVMAFLGTNDLRFTNPVYPSDVISVEVELVSRRLTKAGDRGLVTYNWWTKNQHGEVVCSAQNTCMYKVRE